MNNKIEGIVLSVKDFKDYDAIISVLTLENEILSFLVKGFKRAKSKNASSCNVFTHSTFYYDNKENASMQLLKMAEKKQVFFHIYEDLTRQAIAQIMAEISEKIANSLEVVIFSDLLLGYRLLHEGHNPFVVLGVFLGICNKELGIHPYVDGCIRCHTTSNIASISLRDGGFLCRNCKGEEDKKATKKQLAFFRLFHKATMENVPLIEEYEECSYEEIAILIDLLLEYGGIRLKSITFLEKIVNL